MNTNPPASGSRFTYDHPRPALAVDCVVFGFLEKGLRILLVERGIPPFEGRWALPGGFVRIDEGLEEAARRELREETGLTKLFLEQLATFGEVDRDPRERVVSVAWYALVSAEQVVPHGGSDARRAAWFDLADLPPLAFDHRKIVDTARRRLEGKIRWQPIGFELLPPKFTLSGLQRLYEVVLGRPLDKRNFRKKVAALGLIEPLDEVESGVSHRAARLYRFDEKKYRAATKSGFVFEI
jgi:8-oxo-dGTP diphosphatase